MPGLLSGKYCKRNYVVNSAFLASTKIFPGRAALSKSNQFPEFISTSVFLSKPGPEQCFHSGTALSRIANGLSNRKPMCIQLKAGQVMLAPAAENPRRASGSKTETTINYITIHSPPICDTKNQLPKVSSSICLMVGLVLLSFTDELHPCF